MLSSFWTSWQFKRLTLEWYYLLNSPLDHSLLKSLTNFYRYPKTISSSFKQNSTSPHNYYRHLGQEENGWAEDNSAFRNKGYKRHKQGDSRITHLKDIVQGQWDSFERQSSDRMKIGDNCKLTPRKRHSG